MKRHYGYGIIDRNGNAWWDEACVCKDREPLLEVVENLNEEWRSKLTLPVPCRAPVLAIESEAEMRVTFWRIVNALQGCGFSWIKTPGTTASGYIMPWRRTCPYPLRHDWSARACIKAGDCGCDEKDKRK